jgi:hypothetical protein
MHIERKAKVVMPVFQFALGCEDEDLFIKIQAQQQILVGTRHRVNISYRTYCKVFMPVFQFALGCEDEDLFIRIKA